MYKTYSHIMRLGGFERGIAQYVKNLQFEIGQNPVFLDIGCGTGVVGGTLMKMHPDAHTIFTDVRENFVLDALSNAKIRGFGKKVQGGILDINEPEKVSLIGLDGKEKVDHVLEPESFDVITLGAVLGYSKNPQRSIESIGRLLKPGGIAINIEMKGNMTGKMVSERYGYQSVTVDLIANIASSFGTTLVHPFSLAHFPANLTRVGIITRKILAT